MVSAEFSFTYGDVPAVVTNCHSWSTICTTGILLLLVVNNDIKNPPALRGQRGHLQRRHGLTSHIGCTATGRSGLNVHIVSHANGGVPTPLNSYRCTSQTSGRRATRLHIVPQKLRCTQFRAPYTFSQIMKWCPQNPASHRVPCQQS